jgi:hypothetical protein
MNDELERKCKEAAVADSGIFLERLWKTTKNSVTISDLRAEI